MQVSGKLLHHMEAAKDIQEYVRAAKGFQCKRLLRKLNDIREETPWVAPVALVGQPFIDAAAVPSAGEGYRSWVVTVLLLYLSSRIMRRCRRWLRRD